MTNVVTQGCGDTLALLPNPLDLSSLEKILLESLKQAVELNRKACGLLSNWQAGQSPSNRERLRQTNWRMAL